MRILSSNSHITTLYRSPRDLLSVRYLNTQMFPQNPGFLSWAMNDACKEKFSSLTIDCSPESDSETRVRKSSFPNEDIVVYVPDLK